MSDHNTYERPRVVYSEPVSTEMLLQGSILTVEEQTDYTPEDGNEEGFGDWSW